MTDATHADAPDEPTDEQDVEAERAAHAHDEPDDDIVVEDAANIPPDEGDQAAHDDPANPTA